MHRAIAPKSVHQTRLSIKTHSVESESEQLFPQHRHCNQSDNAYDEQLFRIAEAGEIPMAGAGKNVALKIISNENQESPTTKTILIANI